VAEQWWDIRSNRWFAWKHHDHHRARPCAPYLSQITIKEKPMPTIAGVTLPIVDLTLTLPTSRVDGTALALTEIQSATILRDPGTGVATLTVLNGPFSGATATFTDISPATGSDVYSFFVTDTAGTQGVTSPPVTVKVAGTPTLAQPAAGTLTAVAQIPVVPLAPVAPKPAN
jgi:hypothetical protein